MHFLRNIVNAAPPRLQEGLRTELRKMFNAGTIEEARRIRDEIIDDYAPAAEKSMQILDKGFEDSMTIMCLPVGYRPKLRSTNLIERFKAEIFPKVKAIAASQQALLDAA